MRIKEVIKLLEGAVEGDPLEDCPCNGCKTIRNVRKEITLLRLKRASPVGEDTRDYQFNGIRNAVVDKILAVRVGDHVASEKLKDLADDVDKFFELQIKDK